MTAWQRLFVATLLLGIVMLVAKLAGAHIPWGVVMAPFIPFAVFAVLLLIGGVIAIGADFSEKPRKPE